MGACQFLTEMASQQFMHIEFIPGDEESNPDLKYFILVLQVGDDDVADPTKVDARIVSAEYWGKTHATAFHTSFKERLTMRRLKSEEGGSTELLGYEIEVSVQLETKRNEQPYNAVYINWKEK